MTSTTNVSGHLLKGAPVMKALYCTAIASAIVLSSLNSLFAATLSLGANNITWNPSVDGTPSGIMSVELFNSNVDSELLGGWLIDLGIQPVSGTGTLHFNSASLPVGAAYVLNGNSTPLNGTVSDTSVVAFAAANLAPFGKPVPASGSFLLDLTFDTPDNAAGVFALIAFPGGANTSWNNSLGEDREFVNLPWDASGPLVLGYITVVPEPGTAVMLLIGIVACCGYGLRFRMRSSH